MAIWLSPFEYLTRILGGDYLESGFYDLKSPGKCTPQAYKPATLHYSATTASYVSSTNTPLQGSATFDRGVWQANTQYPAGHPVTPESEGDYTQVWISQNKGISGAAEPVWIPVPGVDVVDNTIIWRYESGYGQGQDEEPFNGQALADGMESLSVGCSNKLETITDPCGTTHTGGGFCSLGVFQKKDAQYKVPSSTYSGKLRLFVQALYGSNRSDYRHSVSELVVGVGGPQEFPETGLPRKFPNSWLYTTNKFHYFLVTYQSGQTSGSGRLTFKFLRLSVQGEGYRKLLNLIPRVDVDFEFRNRVEAYILSTAKIDAEPLYVIPVTGPAVSGSPLDHGWHSTWKGNISDVITFYSDSPNKRYLSNHFKLTITETEVGQAYSFSATMSNPIVDSPWWPRTNGLHVFSYAPSIQAMIEVPYPSQVFGGFEGVFDAPIYCFYTHDILTGTDTLSLGNIFMNLTTDTSDTNIDVSEDKLYSASSITFIDKETFSGIVGTKGFRIAGQTIQTAQKITSFKNKQEVTLVSAPALGQSILFGQGADATPMADGSLDNPSDYMASLGHFPGETREVDGETQYFKFIKFAFIWSSSSEFFSLGQDISGDVFFQVLLGDCSKIVSGKRVTTINPGGSVIGSNPRIDKFLGGQAHWSTSDMSALGVAIAEIVGTLSGGAFVSRLPTYTDNINPSGSSVSTPGNTDNPDIVETIQEIGASGVITISGVAGAFDRYFRPTTSLPHTGSVDYARNSLHNEGRTDHSKYTSDQGYLNDNSVGWQ